MERALSEVRLQETPGSLSVACLAAELWALDESDRLINLALRFPDLLSYEEQLVWRVICEYVVVNNERFVHLNNKGAVDVRLTRDCWPEIKAFALGDGTREQLNTAMRLHDHTPL